KRLYPSPERGGMAREARLGGVSLDQDHSGGDPHPAAFGDRPPPSRGRQGLERSIDDVSGADAAKQSVAVIIPTFNEAESIAAVIAEMPRGVVDRVIVADGGSSDNTPQRARDAG